MRALSRVFRAKYLSALRVAFDRHDLVFAGRTTPLADPAAWAAFITALRTEEWVVYAKPPLGGAAHVLDYLGRYTHRVAIANHRLIDLTQGQVPFRWRDYTDGHVKTMALAADEFIRRFLLHVLPPGFVRIRHFGLLANRRRRAVLAACRLLLGHHDGRSAPGRR